MAPLGPLARLFAQLVVPVVAVLARAIPAAYAQALQNARKSGMDANTAAKAKNLLRKTMSKSEALQVLNLSEGEATAEAIAKVQRLLQRQILDFDNTGIFPNTFISIFFRLQQYEKYMAANDVSKGGSFYLQSKVYRAKELLDEYLEEKKKEEKAGEAPKDDGDTASATDEQQQQQKQ